MPTTNDTNVVFYKNLVLDALNTYPSFYKLSLFGHRHNERAKQLIQAIERCSSIEGMRAMLNRQKDILLGVAINESDSSAIYWDDARWTKQKTLKKAYSAVERELIINKSGFYKVIVDALNKLPAIVLDVAVSLTDDKPKPALTMPATVYAGHDTAPFNINTRAAASLVPVMPESLTIKDLLPKSLSLLGSIPNGDAIAPLFRRSNSTGNNLNVAAPATSANGATSRHVASQQYHDDKDTLRLKMALAVAQIQLDAVESRMNAPDMQLAIQNEFAARVQMRQKALEDNQCSRLGNATDDNALSNDADGDGYDTASSGDERKGPHLW